MLHGLAGTHDRNTADVACELDALVGRAQWGGDLVRLDRQMVQSFFDQQPDDSVRVEYEVCTIRSDIANLAVRGSMLVVIGVDRNRLLKQNSSEMNETTTQD